MSRRKNPNNRIIRIFRVLLHRKASTLAISFLVLVAMIACLVYSWDKGLKPFAKPEPRSWAQIEQSGILRAVTIPTSFTAIEFNDRWYGYEYENARKVAKALDLELEILTVRNEEELLDSLFSGAADVAIWPLAYSVVDNHWYLRPTGNKWTDSQCLCYSKKLDLTAWNDSTLTDSIRQQLPKYPLSIIYGSRQWEAYHNDSVRKYFDFCPYILDSIPPDSLNIEQLTDSLVSGKTAAVMLRCNVAKLMHDYYPIIMLSDTIPFSQDTLAWTVTYKADTLRHLIDSVASELLPTGTPRYSIIANRYGKQKARIRSALRLQMIDGALSPFDDIFRRKADQFGLDWRLLAAIAYIESNFNQDVISSRGPLGLMQLMPQTARSYGYTPEEALDPEINVELAAQLMSNLQRVITKRYPDILEEDLFAFMLTGYNAGIAHLYDAINLAEELGYRKEVWASNVEYCLRLKSDPHYYNLSVVKAGKFNGAFTINYVNEVTAAYQAFCEKVPREHPKPNKKGKAAKKK